MSRGLADADLVTALVKPADHLKARAQAPLAANDLLVPFSVGIELLFVTKKHRVGYVEFLGAASTRFDIDRIDVLLAAAEALDKGEVSTVFDAVHASQALLDGTSLHTSDARLQASPFPTTPF